jgi:hypothetical protein
MRYPVCGSRGKLLFEVSTRKQTRVTSSTDVSSHIIIAQRRRSSTQVYNAFTNGPGQREAGRQEDFADPEEVVLAQ